MSVSLAVLPVPPLVEETFPLVLSFDPLLVAVTSTATVQLAPPPTEPPLKVRLVAAAAGVHVPAQVVLAFGVAATCTPAGRESVNASPVNAVLPFGLVIVKVSVLTPPTLIGFGANAFPMLGAMIEVLTVRASVPVLPVPPLVDD